MHVGHLLVAMAAAFLWVAVHQAVRARTPGRPWRIASTLAATAALLLSFLCAFVALPYFLRFRLKPMTSEAKSNLGAIRGTEVAYFAEWNSYVGGQPPIPVADRHRNSVKTAWPADTRFSVLGFAPEGGVRCSYSLDGPRWPSEQEGFTARAECDLDGDGELAVYTITQSPTVFSRSASGEIAISGNIVVSGDQDDDRP